MRKLNYEQYADKVYGCWIGKCVSGTIGMPYEGRKEWFQYSFDSTCMQTMVPNDDLDLQVIWLEVLETKGIYLQSRDLAEAFYLKCPYAPGEYAYFKKNFERGVYPPYSGSFNNDYYRQGMGSPIRSEIWACISPGNPHLAAHYAELDGVLDHEGDSVYAEKFFAALEAEAFFESDLHHLLQIGLHYLPPDTRIYQLVKDVIHWSEIHQDWVYVRGLILRTYGHPDCTNLYQNIGFTLLALLYGNGDFIETTMIALNCGFDTDCTCATAGSILGIIYGAKNIQQKYGFEDPGYVLEVDVIRRSNRVYDLAEDVAKVGMQVTHYRNPDIQMIGAPESHSWSTTHVNQAPITFNIAYKTMPSIRLGGYCHIEITIKNNSSQIRSGVLHVSIPEQWQSHLDQNQIELAPISSQMVKLEVHAPDDLEFLAETNLLSVLWQDTLGYDASYQFGVVGAVIWNLYGPFWDNNVEIPELPLGSNYYPYLQGADRNTTSDLVRTYHLNMRVNPHKCYLPEPELKSSNTRSRTLPEAEGVIVYTERDRFSLGDLIGFQGPCVVYVERILYCPEDRHTTLHIGHSDAYRLWLDGSLISQSDDVDWWTAENKHIHDVFVSKGFHRIVMKLVRRSREAEFSMFFAKDGLMQNHYSDFTSYRPDRDVEQKHDIVV